MQGVKVLMQEFNKGILMLGRWVEEEWEVGEVRVVHFLQGI